jgi:hypothetical protein
MKKRSVARIQSTTAGGPAFADVAIHRRLITATRLNNTTSRSVSTRLSVVTRD